VYVDNGFYMDDPRVSECSNFGCKYVSFNDKDAKRYQKCKTTNSKQECCVATKRQPTKMDKEMGITTSSLNDFPGCPIYCQKAYC